MEDIQNDQRIRLSLDPTDYALFSLWAKQRHTTLGKLITKALNIAKTDEKIWTDLKLLRSELPPALQERFDAQNAVDKRAAEIADLLSRFLKQDDA